MKRIFVAIFITFSFAPFGAFANSDTTTGGGGLGVGPIFPSFPMSFYGTVNLNGAPLPFGSRVLAFASSTLLGAVTLDEAGVYGYDNPIKNKLVVKSYEGAIIFKYTLPNVAMPESGCLVQQYDGEFVQGGVVSLNLSFKNTDCSSGSTGSTVSSGGGGGAVSAPTSCASVSYSSWQANCTNDLQVRSVVTQMPAGCALTAEQQAATKKTCQIATTTDDKSGAPPKVLGIKIDNNSKTSISSGNSNNLEDIKSVVAEEKVLVKKDDAMSKRMRGQILIQVENKGQAWYVNPDSGKKYFLGRPADAFDVMRKQGLGVKNNVIKNTKVFSGKLLGRILINVEDKGKAYYINPKDKKAYFLGRPGDAFNVMRKLGLGINNINIRKIEVGEN